MAREPELDTRRSPSVWSCLRTLLLVLLAFVLLLAGGMIYVGVRAESLTEDMPATLHVTDGKAKILRSGTIAWVPAADLLPLAPGDTIRVDDGSGIILYFFDGSRIHLGAGAQLSLRTSVRSLDRPPLLSPILQEMLPDYPAPLDARTQATIVATLQMGQATIYSGASASPDSYFRLDTPSTTIQGDATVYAVAVDAESATVIDAINGAVLVAALARFPDESDGIAVTSLQPGNSMHVLPLSADSETSELAARQRAAAWTVLGLVAGNGMLPAHVEGLATEPAAGDGTVIAYHLIPSPAPTPTLLPAMVASAGGDATLPQVQSGPDIVAPSDDQPANVLPSGLVLTPIENFNERFAEAQLILQPKELTISKWSDRDLGARLPGGMVLRIQGGGVITARVQGVSYTVTVGANRGQLSMGGLPPGVNVPDLPAKIVSVASEPGELTIVYQELR